MTPLLGRGLARADAIVLDVSVVGEEVARRRVLDLWRNGASLFDLEDVGWLLVLAEPMTWRSHLAPGTLLQRCHGSLLAWGMAELDVVPGDVALPHHGHVVVRRLADLAELDPAAWLTLDGLAPSWLDALDAPAPEATSLGSPDVPAAPNLRDAAGIGPMADADAAIGRELLGQAPPAGLRSPKAGTGAGREAVPTWRTWADRLLGASPSRHERYLAELRRALEEGRLDEALRRAIPLGGWSTGLTSRLPRPRRDLTPSRTPPRPGPTVDFGETEPGRLRTLYLRAADRLESEGRIDEAAFVHADLLRAPSEAVAMLERHGRWRLAAEVADAHGLAPERRFRLWWRAGDRERAVGIARRHQCFPLAIARLQPTEPERALGLRRLWVEERRAAGDLLGAVEAAWPVAELRATVVEDIVAGLALSGTATPRLLAHLLAAVPHADAADAARVILTAPEPERARSRAALVVALGDLTAADLAVDRELASSASLALLLLTPDDLGIPERSRKSLVTRLAQRADPLLAADLPPSAAAGRAPRALSVEAQPGSATRVFDAVTIDGGLVLLARGEAGVTAVRSTGQVVAHWDVPTHRLVPADHGAAVLLLADRHTAVEVTNLDLVTRRTRSAGALRLRVIASSYDGALWAVGDELGLAVVDMAAPRPTVLWRGLGDRASQCAAAHPEPPLGHRPRHGSGDPVDRPHRAVGLAAPGDGDRQPGGRLPTGSGQRVALTASDHLGVEEDGGTVILDGFGRSVELGPGPVQSLLCDGDAFAVTRLRPPGLSVLVGADRLDRPLHSVEMPTRAALGLRRHGATVTLWSDEGHVVAIDMSTQQLVANLHAQA